MSEDHTITVTENGPYMVAAGLPVASATGEAVHGEKAVFLCRCGQSAKKPFCDGTHKKVGFDGTEMADRAPMASRSDVYEGDGITVYDDRARCAHAGRCTDGLPAVWKLGVEPWIDARGASAAQIAAVVASCPSGALTYTLPGSADAVEEALEPGVAAVPNGPYRVTGDVVVVAGDGHEYERRNRQTLCRCGQSKNKPFCDGSHWYAEFRDPV